MLRYKTEIAWFSLVTLYDIQPGNGVGLFLQPQSHMGQAWEKGAYWPHQ